MTKPDPAENLCEEILAEGTRRAEESPRGGQQAERGILAKAASEAEKARRDGLEAARSEAARRRERILADLPVELGRRRAAHVEAAAGIPARRGPPKAPGPPGLRLPGDPRLPGGGGPAADARRGLRAGLAPETGDRLVDGRFAPCRPRRPTLTLVEDPSITEGGVDPPGCAGPPALGRPAPGPPGSPLARAPAAVAGARASWSAP